MELNGKRVLTIVSPDYDDLELWYPIIRLREAGAHVDIAGKVFIERYGQDALHKVAKTHFANTQKIINL